MLNDARVLAQQTAAVDVALDADLYQGRLYLQTGRWDAGNALLQRAVTRRRRARRSAP